MSLSLATGLSRGAYDVKYTDGNGNTSPTYRLNICLPAFTGMADRVSGTAANLLLTVTTPFNSGYPFCVATPATVNGTNQGWEASTWGTVRNKTASGWELIQPIIGPAPIPDLAQLTGYVICATSTAAGAAVTIVGTYTAQLPSIVPFIKAAYQDFLGRQPSSQEVTDWAGRLTAVTVTREGFLRSVANSPEWLGLIVRKMYLDTLGREPDPVGLATWVDWIRTGRVTVVAAAAGFYSSPEFYQGLGGNTLTTWVTKLYEKLLNRAPDPAGLQFWIGYAANPAYGHTWVAEQFYQSLESRLTRVKNLYQALLKRDPDPTGWPFWAQIILTKGDVELAVSLASSAEYDLRAQARFP